MRTLATLVLTAVLLGAGCSSVSVETDQPKGPKREHWVNVYFWGVIGGELEVEGENLAKVLVDDTLFQKIVKFITGGIYCPITITVWYVE